MSNAGKIMIKEIFSNLKFVVIAFISALIIQLLSLVQPQIMRRIIDIHIVNKDMKSIYISIIFMVGIPIISTLINVLYSAINAWAAKKISTGLTRKIFMNNIRQPLCFFDESKSGELTNRSGAEFSGFINFWLIDVPNTLVNVIVSGFILVTLFKINTTVTIIQIAAIPIFLIPSLWLNKHMDKYVSNIMENLSKAKHTISESYIGVRFIKAYNLENNRCNKIKEYQDNQLNSFAKTVAWERIAGDWSLQLISVALIGLSFSILALSVIKGDITIGMLTVYIAYLPKIHNAIIYFSSSNLKFRNEISTHRETFEAFSRKLEDEEFGVTDIKELKNTNTNIKLENVCFKYPSAPDYILNNLTLEVNEGEFVGIIGESGVGKTTIFDLLLRFYNIDKGNVFVNGINVKNIPSESLRKNIALVSQDIFLIAGTIKENLLLVKPTATDEEIYEAVRKANLTEVINKLPEGIDTYIGENASKLSGGEKQRLSIARALLSNRKIILLDEVTSALDNNLESEIESAILNLVKSENITVIAIAHRLQFLQQADKIYLIKNGTIDDLGTYGELKQRGKLFENVSKAVVE